MKQFKIGVMMMDKIKQAKKALEQIANDKDKRQEILNAQAESQNVTGNECEKVVCGKPNCTREKLDNSPLCAYHWDIANS